MSQLLLIAREVPNRYNAIYKHDSCRTTAQVISAATHRHVSQVKQIKHTLNPRTKSGFMTQSTTNAPA